MASVDNRIVNMQFNNADFERKISQTLKSLQGLDKAIATSGAGGLAGLEKSIGKFSMNPITSAIEGVSAKFLALSTIGITALANITNRAIDAGISIGKSLSLDPIMDGFAEYELNMNSIQTILANTRRQGTTLEDVNGALDELNEYSDLTIYNFAQMTKNIGAATAAGVDLDTATTYVKGFANSAAVAGADSATMAGALEQMSQALGAGVIKAQDWISLEKRGLAGQVQQEAFFDMAKAMGTLADVPLDKSFKEWSDEGNTLKGSLKDGWLTAEVFTNTMGVFAGEMDRAKLAGLGYTDEMIDEALELGEVAVDAATKVRTMTALFDTTQEQVASGWSQTFRTIVGDFEEASELFTNVSSALGDMIGASAARRNEVLQEWADLGGRTELIEGLRLSFVNLGKIFGPIRDAFREVFPRKTGEDLYNLTVRFREFAESLEPSERTMKNLRRIFAGVFNVIGVGIDLFKTLASAVGEMVQEFTGLGSGETLGFLAEIGDALAELTADDVIAGVRGFFDELGELFENPIPYIEDLWDTIKNFFRNFDVDAPDIPGIGNPLEKLGERFERLKTVFDRIGDVFAPFRDAFNRIKGISEDVLSFFGDIVEDIIDAFSDAIETGDYDGVSDAINLGLIGAIGYGINKFLNEGIKVDFSGGLLKSISGTFEELTGVLSAMQTNLKADALQKIGYAIATLTASVLVLSLIDSDALKKALTAMAVGFGQLMTSLVILQKITFGPGAAAQFLALAAVLTGLAGAVLLLSLAVRLLGGMDLEDLVEGVGGLVGVLASLVATTKLLSGNVGSLYSAAGAMIAIGGALILMSTAMRIMGNQDLESLAKGFAGVIGGLISMAGIMHLFPKDMALRSTGIFSIAASLTLLGFAVRVMGNLSWEEIGKGLVGTGIGLAAMGRSLQLMPVDLKKIGGTVLAISVAFFFLAKSLQEMAKIGWEELARGLLATSVSLVLIAGTAKAMETSKFGGISFALFTLGLSKLADIIKAFSKLSITEVAKGLLVMAISMGALAGVAMLIAPAVVPMLGLAAAMFLLGAGVAGLGLGLSLVVGAFATMAKIGPGAGAVFLEILESLAAALPALMAGFAKGLLGMGQVILDGLPEIAEVIGELIVVVLEQLKEIIPLAAEVMIELLEYLAATIIETAPELTDAAYTLLMEFLRGINENIEEVAAIGLSILGGLLEGVAEGLPDLIGGLVELIASALTSVAEGLGELIPTIMIGLGVSFLKGFWEGIKKELGRLEGLVTGFITDIINWVKSGFGIASPSKVMIDIGTDVINGLIKGVEETAKLLFTWFVELPMTIVQKIGNVTRTLYNKGKDVLNGLWDGVKNVWNLVKSWFLLLPSRILSAIGNVVETLYNKGKDFLTGLWDGVKYLWDLVKNWFLNLHLRVTGAIGDVSTKLYQKGLDLLQGLWNGLKDKAVGVLSWAGDFAGNVVTAMTQPWKMLSPSRVTKEMGGYFMEGLLIGMVKGSDPVIQATEDTAKSVSDALKRGLEQAVKIGNDMATDISPVITPVFDLSQLAADAKKVDSLFPTVAAGSYSQAAIIASSPSGRADLVEDGGGREVQFIQNNTSPKALSTADIYRQTRNQIAMAKEELDIA